MILKRKRIINLAIYKTADWYRDDDVRVLEPTKIPLARLPTKCGRKCEFSEICSFWAPKYRLVGIDRVKTQYYTTYNISGSIRLCNCGGSGKFEYIFTYETLCKYIPLEVLKKIGLYREPKLPKQKLFYDNHPPKNYNSKSYHGGGNIKTTKNYNTRRK